MSTDSQHEANWSGIVARGGGAGGLWGGLIGLAVLLVGSVAAGDLLAMAYAPVPMALGGMVGGLQGLMSGLILACRERRHPRSDSNRRATAAVSGLVAWAMVGLLLIAVSEGIDVGGTVVVLVLALTGAAAAAALAPCVVKGSTSVAFVHRP